MSCSENSKRGKRMKRRVLALMLIVALIFTLSGCDSSKAESEGTTEDTSGITEKIIASFEELTEIPRPTYYEKEVSDFLKNWAENQGLEVVQDEANNIIAEVPATEGMEDKPLVVLQGHMDMVFAQKDGLYLDPLTTKIEVINDGKYLKSDGKTSLGGDDGIGVAIMECIAEGKMSHGPLRLIITTDEEQESTGAMNLDKKYLMGKFVNPEVIEEKFKESPFILEMMVVGEGQKFAAALIAPDFEFLKDWQCRHGINCQTREEMVADKQTLERYKRVMAKYNSYFGETEQVKKFKLLTDTWSEANGLITPTLKIKRKKVAERYSQEIENLFK